MLSMGISLPLQCVIIVLALAGGVQSSACYYPDGTLARDYDYVACTGSQYSSCCIPAEGDVCLSNGLCYFSSGDYPFRGACTDQTWKSSSCPKYCNASTPDSWEMLIACGGTKWCCSSGGSDCCTKPNLVFDIGVPSVVNDYGSMSATMLATSSGHLITALAGAVSSSGPSSAPSGTGSSNSTTSAGSDSGVGKGTIIGIAVGALTFVVLVGAAVLAWCCLRRRKSSNSTPTPNLIDMHSPSAGDNASIAPMFPGKVDTYPPAPSTPWGEAAPPYQQGYYAQQYQQPQKGPHGQDVFELQSPVVKPSGQNGQVYHELG